MLQEDPLKEAIEVEKGVSMRGKAEKIAHGEICKRELNEVPDEKIEEGFNFFKEKGIDPYTVCFVWANTHDFENAEVSLGMLGRDKKGNEVRYELTDYEKPTGGEMEAEYRKYKEEMSQSK